MEERFCGDDAAHKEHVFRAGDEVGQPRRKCGGRLAEEVLYGDPEYAGNPNGYVQRESDAGYTKPPGDMHEPPAYPKSKSRFPGDYDPDLFGYYPGL